MNCAAVWPEIRFLNSADTRESIYGAKRGGILNEANIVMQSRRVKSAYEGRGTARGTDPTGPNMRTNERSLYIHKPTLAADEATNFPAPEETVVAGLLVTVDVAVSRALAVRYVPPYSMKMRAQGREKSADPGRSRRFLTEDRIESSRELRPEAFSMMDLIHLLVCCGYLDGLAASKLTDQ